MTKTDPKNTSRQEEHDGTERKAFEEPKLEFVEPKLKDHGDLTKLTHGFFGTFTP